MQQRQNQNAELRSKFIISESAFLNEQLDALVERVKDYCVLDESGTVHLRRRGLAQWKQVGLVLLARFIGSKLDSTIRPVLSADEVATFAGIGKAEAVARGKELVDRGFATRPGKGQYRMNPARIEDFVAALGEAKA